jgi:hypothetical protein
MPRTPARAIPGVRLEHDYRAYLSGSFVLHHPLIAGGTIVSSERGLAGVRAHALDMLKQRGYSRRSVAHIAAVICAWHMVGAVEWRSEPFGAAEGA